MTRSKRDVANIAMATRYTLYTLFSPLAFLLLRHFLSPVIESFDGSDGPVAVFFAGVLNFCIAAVIAWCIAEADAFLFRLRAELIWSDAWETLDIKSHPESQLGVGGWIYSAALFIVFPAVTCTLFAVFGVGNGWGWFSLFINLLTLFLMLVLSLGEGERAKGSSTNA